MNVFSVMLYRMSAQIPNVFLMILYRMCAHIKNVFSYQTIMNTILGVGIRV